MRTKTSVTDSAADPDLPPGYPVELTEHAFLEDGTPVLFRAIRPDDAERLERLFYRLSPQTLYLRFFTPLTRINRSVVTHLVTVDYVDRLAIVAVIDGQIVGVARYERLAAVAPAALQVDPGEAEAAVVVEDAWQGHGIGTRLLWRLSAAAPARGVHTFTATVLATNRVMLGLLHVLGETVHTQLEGGEYTVKLRIAGADAPPSAPGDPASPAPS
jgi:GNAT superfamily N-acetyltransferase